MRQVQLPLSSLVAGKRNPRKVKPDRDAHRQMVASIKAIGLLHPLTVRPHPDHEGQYIIIAGHRRWGALKDIHRGNGHGVKVLCQVRDVDEPAADAVSLSENFTRSAMHPLDEAEAFAKLATEKGNVEAVVSEFGVSDRYVKQRIKLASLTREIKTAYREGRIDTGTAEAFSAAPEVRQAEVWNELRGQPQSAEQVRHMIAHGWIEATHARFDLATLPENVVSRDLFSEQVLIERSAFMEAQTQALAILRQALLDDGWSTVIAGTRDELFPQFQAMELPEREYDPKTARKLAKLAQRQNRLEMIRGRTRDGSDADKRIQSQFATLDAAVERLVNKAPDYFSAATQAIGTVFLLLAPDGRVYQEVRVPRQKDGQADANGDEQLSGNGPMTPPKPPTAAELNDRQRATAFTHQTLAVREALLESPLTRKRLLVMMLHESIETEALAIGHDTNGVTLHATEQEGFASPVWDRLRERHKKIDPLVDSPTLLDQEAYAMVSKLSAAKLDALIDLLIVEKLTAHATHRTYLVEQLGAELKVDVRKDWRPDVAWLANYQKCQLADLLHELYGPAYDVARETRKKSELVTALATLFADAANGKVEDKKLADRVNRWLPANLRPEAEDAKALEPAA